MDKFSYKEAVVYGIPARGYSCGRKQFSCIKMIIPVHDQPLGQETRVCSKQEIYSAGLHPLTYFRMELVPMTSYLCNYTIPSYIKFKMFYPELNCTASCSEVLSPCNNVTKL